jgi:hypothetical protein
MKESEQAQAIEDIRGRIEYDTESDRDGGPFIEDLKSEPLHQDRIDLLKIVDSQAQKIRELTENTKKHPDFEDWLAQESKRNHALKEQTAEQAKEIEILREAAKYDKYTNLAHIMKRPKDVSFFTHKKAEWLQKLHEFDEAKQ